VTRTGLLLLAVTLLVACEVPEEEEPPAGPCLEVWGPTPATGRLHADADADAGGDGSSDAPFSTLTDALDAARATGIRSSVLAPGEYPGRYGLSNDEAGWQDSGLEIAGCGREETLLIGVEAEEQVGDQIIERLQPVFDIAGETTAGIHVHDLAAVGGRRGVKVRSGAGAEDPIVLERIDVIDSVRMGVLVDGVSTVTHLLDVAIAGVEPEDGEFGWGVGLQTAAWTGADLPGPLVLQGVTISDVHQLGVLAHGGWVEITSSSISDVASASETHGRGVQLQQWTRGLLEDVQVMGVSDAAVFLESPGRDGDPVEVYDCLLGPTSEATVPDSAGTAADGLVATQSADEPAGAGEFHVVFDGNQLQDNPRVHVLAETVTLSLGEDNIFGKGGGYPVVSQGGAVVQGIGGGEPGYPPEELGEDEALELNRAPLELDDLSVD